MLRELESSRYPQFFCISYMIIKKYYPGEPVNIHIQSLINITQEKNWGITTKKDKVKLLLSCGNGEPVITIYDVLYHCK